MAGAWTDEVVERLRTLSAEGLSCSQIATRLNVEFRAGLSRNAVIGKLHRAGIYKLSEARASKPGAVAAPRLAAIPKAVPKPAAPRHIWGGLTQPTPPENKLNAALANAEARAAPPSPNDDLPGKRTLLTLGFGECKWPVGDRAAGLTFCGCQAVRGAYCEPHAARAYVSVPGKKRVDTRLGIAGMAA